MDSTAQHFWESGHGEPISAGYSTTVFTALRYSRTWIVSTQMLSWVGLYLSMRNTVFKRLQIQMDSVYRCSSGRNYSPSTHLGSYCFTCRTGWEVSSAKTSYFGWFEIRWGALLPESQSTDVSKHTKTPGHTREVTSTAVLPGRCLSLHSQKTSVRS